MCSQRWSGPYRVSVLFKAATRLQNPMLLSSGLSLSQLVRSRFTGLEERCKLPELQSIAEEP